MNPYAIVVAGVIVAWFIGMLFLIPFDLAELASQLGEEEVAGLGQERPLTGAEAPSPLGAVALVVTAEAGRPYDWASDGLDAA